MYPEERRQLIVDRARRSGRVGVSALATQLDVTPETVRRDLTELERQGFVRRVHGGAIPVERLRLETPVAERLGEMVEEKARIARVAVELIPDGGTVALDAGTTTGAIVEALPPGADVTIVTNGLPIATALVGRPGVEVLLAGGRVRPRTLATVGDTAGRFIRSLTPDVTFVATNGVTVEDGLTTPDLDEAAVKRSYVEAGGRVVLVADHTKVGQRHFVRFADLDQIDTFVTDEGADDELVAPFSEAGVEVVRA